HREQKEKPGPHGSDTAVLEVQAPRGATVRLDGQDQGDQRRFLFRSLAGNRLYQHAVVVRFPDGREVRRDLLLKAGWHVRLPVASPRTARFDMVMQCGHSKQITAAAYSPDGAHILTAGDDRTAILWDAATGRALRVFQAHIESSLRVAHWITNV